MLPEANIQLNADAVLRAAAQFEVETGQKIPELEIEKAMNAVFDNAEATRVFETFAKNAGRIAGCHR